MGALPPIQGPHESTADYFEHLLRYMSGTHGGLLCPQRFMYKDDDAYVNAVRKWNAERPSIHNWAIAIIGIISVVFIITMLVIIGAK